MKNNEYWIKPDIFWISVELAHKKENEIHKIIENWLLKKSIIKEDIKHIFVFTDIDLYSKDFEKKTKLNENFFFCKNILLKHKDDLNISNEFIEKKPYFYFMKEMKNIFFMSQLHILFWNQNCNTDFNLEKFKNSCVFNDIKNEKSIIIFLHQKLETLEKLNHYDIFNYISVMKSNINMPRFIKICKKVLIGINNLFVNNLYDGLDFNQIFFPHLDYYEYYGLSNNHSDKNFEFIIDFTSKKENKINYNELKCVKEFISDYLHYIIIKNKKLNNTGNEFYFKIPINLSVFKEYFNYLFIIKHNKTLVLYKIFINEKLENGIKMFLEEWNDYINKNIKLKDLYPSDFILEFYFLKKENWDKLLYQNCFFDKNLIIIDTNKKLYFFNKNTFLIPDKFKYKNHTSKFIFKYKKIQKQISYFNLEDFTLYCIKSL